MTKIAPKIRRWVSLAIAGTVLVGLSGCASFDVGDVIDGGARPPSPSRSTDSADTDQAEETAVQAAAKECFPGIWIMDKAVVGSVMFEAEVLASKEIEGTALLIANTDGTVTMEYLDWRYIAHAPPNPILGDQAPTTTTITLDSSEPGTYRIDAAGVITVTLDDGAGTADEDDDSQILTCAGNLLVEKVPLLDTEIVYHRRG